MSIYLDKTNELKTKLTNLGLDKNEAAVYLSLLKLGEVGASKVVSDTKLHGQTVYTALDTLEAKNLVRYVLVKGRKRFSAQNPKILLNMVEQQRSVAQSVAEELEHRFSAVDLQHIEILKGVEAFRASELQLLAECAPGENLLVFGGLGDSYIQSHGNQFNEYEYQRRKQKLGVRYLGISSQAAYLQQSKEDRYNFEFRFINAAFSGVTTTCVFGTHAVAIYIFDETVTCIILRNAKIAESYTGFFNGLWGA
jgi:predicted DNA-binding transcriptional regulator